MRVLRFFYNLAFPVVLLAMLPNFIFRMLKRGKYRHKFGQRFGIYSERVQEKFANHRWTWVHAVSVGEVLIALKLIREMKRQDSDLCVALSTQTSTGFALANEQRSEWLEPIYNPVDFFWTVGRALRMIRPHLLILVEAEVWPNLTAQAKAQGARLVLVNARLSQRSEKRYQWARFLVAPIFRQLDLLCVQEPADRGRWAAIGAPAKRILCPGSIKFDDADKQSQPRRDFRPVLRDLGVPDDAPVLLAASTHAGEELLLGQIFLRLRRRFPEMFYVVVPRHAERGREVREDLEKIGLRTVLRVGETEKKPTCDALIVNTTGELRDWYPCAGAVFVGKSLTARGGQNPAEAIAAGRPTVVGPNMQNFATLVAQLVRANGIVQVPDAEALERTLDDFLAYPRDAAEQAARGMSCLEVHRGATERTVKAIRALTVPQ